MAEQKMKWGVYIDYGTKERRKGSIVEILTAPIASFVQDKSHP